MTPGPDRRLSVSRTSVHYYAASISAHAGAKELAGQVFAKLEIWELSGEEIEGLTRAGKSRYR